MKISRTDRLNGELQKAIYDIIMNKLKNPYITEMVSILRVDCTNDLAHAKVNVSIFSTNAERAALTYKAIEDSAKQIRYELAKKSKMRTVPELHFVLDDSMAYSDKINKVLNSLNIKPEEEEE